MTEMYWLFVSEICFQAVATVCQALHFGMIFTTLGGANKLSDNVAIEWLFRVIVTFQGEKCTFLLLGST